MPLKQENSSKETALNPTTLEFSKPWASHKTGGTHRWKQEPLSNRHYTHWFPIKDSLYHIRDTTSTMHPNQQLIHTNSQGPTVTRDIGREGQFPSYGVVVRLALATVYSKPGTTEIRDILATGYWHPMGCQAWYSVPGFSKPLAGRATPYPMALPRRERGYNATTYKGHLLVGPFPILWCVQGLQYSWLKTAIRKATPYPVSRVPGWPQCSTAAIESRNKKPMAGEGLSHPITVSMG